jgi:cytidine deaminase
MIADAGKHKIQRVAIVSPKAAPCMPCGACRQVLAEFGCDEVVVEEDSKPRILGFDEILPNAFGPESL